jgi:glutamate-1-semialdehyde 2,1-aminomutase
LLLPKEGYLQSLRDLCTENETLLIFDEVMTGFRVAPGGAQELYGIKPDLTTLGKVIGGGLPVGAYGGRADIMQMVAPLGEVYQAGTLSGNPLAMACGVAQLRIVKNDHVLKDLSEITDKLVAGIQKIIDEQKIDAIINKTSGMFTIFFTKKEVFDFESAKKSDTKKFARFWQNLLEEGVYWPPSQFEAAFVSTMHTDFDVNQTLKAFESALKNLD